jgi:hypothetical protein
VSALPLHPVRLWPASVRTLLAGAIDYAGLFPPAALPMADAARNYAEYAAGDDSWALGRFVVPSARLGELRDVLGAPLRESLRGVGWRLAALVSDAPDREIARIRDFEARLDAHAVVASVEGKGATHEAIARMATYAAAGLETYVEIPLDDHLRDNVAAVREAGARAKIRTGGVVRTAFPAAADIARFLRTCRDAAVSFKATAGLHHPVRASHPLTYDPGCDRAVMFGFVNVLLAAAFTWIGDGASSVVEVLEERDASAFRFSDTGIEWRGRLLPVDVIARVRAGFALGFGSCSFREPLDEISVVAR